MGSRWGLGVTIFYTEQALGGQKSSHFPSDTILATNHFLVKDHKQMQHTKEREKIQVICLLSLQYNGLNPLYIMKDCLKEYTSFVLKIVVGIYYMSILETRTDTEVNLPRTSLVWKCVPGHQITEASNDLGSSRRLMFSQG